MNKKTLIAGLSKAKSLMPQQDILAALGALAEARIETVKAERDIVRLEVVRDVSIVKMELRYSLLHEVVAAVFSERRDTIDKLFALVDKGLAEGRDDVVLEALRSVGKIVASSPFADIGKLAAALDDGDTIEI